MPSHVPLTAFSDSCKDVLQLYWMRPNALHKVIIHACKGVAQMKPVHVLEGVINN